MKLFLGFLTLALALIISGVAAYFSVVGLAAIFSATAGAVIIMGIALEAGKLTSAGWLHANWGNRRVSKLHKGYMVAAVIALMIITSLGIYGFLAKGHLEQQAPMAPVELQIAQKQARVDQINADMTRLTAQQGQIDGAVNAVIGQDATKGLRARGRLTVERKEIQAKITANTTELNTLTTELVPLKLQINEVETKLGPIKYIADLFGIKDTEGAVRIVILILMFAFDPLAVVMVLSAAISIEEGFEARRGKRTASGMRLPSTRPKHYDIPEGFVDGYGTIEFDDTPKPPSIHPHRVESTPGLIDAVGSDVELIADPEEPEAVITDESVEETVEDVAAQNLLVELENDRKATEAEDAILKAMYEASVRRAQTAQGDDDKERLLEILERKPELLEQIVEAVRHEDEAQKEEQPEINLSWLDTDPAK